VTEAARPALAPEAAANGGAAVPRHAPTRPRPARLWDGHLGAECSRRGGGAPACPACLAAVLGAERRPPLE
jgi:hypothetical protein